MDEAGFETPILQANDDVLGFIHSKGQFLDVEAARAKMVNVFGNHDVSQGSQMNFVSCFLAQLTASCK